MRILGINKTTLLDYPGLVATTLFTGGCNFRCPFCHNGDLVLYPQDFPEITREEIFAHLAKRKGIITGVCITGGEPTLQNDLPNFIREIRALGYQIKLDTNGYCPDVLRGLLADGLLDYVAMDIKASRSNYGKACGIPSPAVSLIEESVSLLKNADISYEFRTTVVKGIHTVDDFLDIREWLAGPSPYYLQSYKESDAVIQKKYTAFETEELEDFLSLLQKTMSYVFLRGVE